MGGEEQADSDERSGLALAAALVERQDVRETRRAATGRSAKKGAMDESMRIVYAPTVDVLENAALRVVLCSRMSCSFSPKSATRPGTATSSE